MRERIAWFERRPLTGRAADRSSGARLRGTERRSSRERQLVIAGVSGVVDARGRMTKNAPERKGLLLVYTGKGKGKTTAALGIVFRALGRGLRVAVIQFIKGKWKTGERTYAETL